MDTRGRPGDIGPDREQPAGVVGRDTAEVVELSVVSRSRRGMGAAALVVVAGVSVVLLAGLSALGRGNPAASAAAIGSIGQPPTATPIPTAAPTRTPRPTSGPRPTAEPTPAPTHLPWEYAASALTGFDGFSGGVMGMWALSDRFVVVDAPDDELESRFLTSPDGRTWTTGTSPRAEFTARAGTVADGRLWLFGSVADAYGERWSLWTTTDALTWTRVVGPDGLGDGVTDVRDLERGPSGWVVAVSVLRPDVDCHVPCSGGELRYSPDGVHWQVAAVPGLGTFAEVAGVAFSGSRWVAVFNGYDADLDRTNILATSSIDGTTWSAATPVASLDGLATGVAALGDRFVIVGEEEDDGLHPRSWSSADGIAWTYTGIDEPVDRELLGMGAVIPTRSGFLALSASETGVAWRWTAGKGWRDFPILPPGVSDHLGGIAVLGDIVLVGGFNNEDLTRMWVGSLDAMNDE